METLLASRTLTVRFADGGAEQAIARALPVRRYQDYLAALDDECRMIELATGQPPEWVDRLTLESHEQLVAAIEELNRDFFGRWSQRRLARMREVAPELSARWFLGPEQQPSNGGSSSKNGSPKSPSEPG